MKFNRDTSLAKLLLTEEIARSHQTVDNDPFHYSDDDNVKIDMYANDEGSWSVKVDCTTDPSLSYPLQRFPDEGSANHYARQCSDRIIRRRMNETYSLMHQLPSNKPLLQEGLLALLFGVLGLLATKWFMSSFKFVEVAEGEATNYLHDKDLVSNCAEEILSKKDYKDLDENGWDLENEEHRKVWLALAAENTEVPPESIKKSLMAWKKLDDKNFKWYPPKPEDPENETPEEKKAKSDWQNNEGKAIKSGIYDFGGWMIGHLNGWYGGQNENVAKTWPGGGDLTVPVVSKKVQKLVKDHKALQKDRGDVAEYYNLIQTDILPLLLEVYGKSSRVLKGLQWPGSRASSAIKKIKEIEKFWLKMQKRFKAVENNISKSMATTWLSKEQQKAKENMDKIQILKADSSEKLGQFLEHYDGVAKAFGVDSGLNTKEKIIEFWNSTTDSNRGTLMCEKIKEAWEKKKLRSLGFHKKFSDLWDNASAEWVKWNEGDQKGEEPIWKQLFETKENRDARQAMFDAANINDWADGWDDFKKLLHPNKAAQKADKDWWQRVYKNIKDPQKPDVGVETVINHVKNGFDVKGKLLRHLRDVLKADVSEEEELSEELQAIKQAYDDFDLKEFEKIDDLEQALKKLDSIEATKEARSAVKQIQEVEDISKNLKTLRGLLFQELFKGLSVDHVDDKGEKADKIVEKIFSFLVPESEENTTPEVQEVINSLESDSTVDEDTLKKAQDELENDSSLSDHFLEFVPEYDDSDGTLDALVDDSPNLTTMRLGSENVLFKKTEDGITGMSEEDIEEEVGEKSSEETEGGSTSPSRKKHTMSAEEFNKELAAFGFKSGLKKEKYKKYKKGGKRSPIDRIFRNDTMGVLAKAMTDLELIKLEIRDRKSLLLIENVIDDIQKKISSRTNIDSKIKEKLQNQLSQKQGEGNEELKNWLLELWPEEEEASTDQSPEATQALEDAIVGNKGKPEEQVAAVANVITHDKFEGDPENWDKPLDFKVPDEIKDAVAKQASEGNSEHFTDEEIAAMEKGILASEKLQSFQSAYNVAMNKAFKDKKIPPIENWKDTEKVKKELTDQWSKFGSVAQKLVKKYESLLEENKRVSRKNILKEKYSLVDLFDDLF